MADLPEGRWVPAIAIEATATPEQRQRNWKLYERLRDGVPGDYQQPGLAAFVFEIPTDSVSTGLRGETLAFRLDSDGECYRRLLRVISDHFDSECDADQQVARMRKALEWTLGIIKIESPCAHGDGCVNRPNKCNQCHWRGLVEQALLPPTGNQGHP